MGPSPQLLTEIEDDVEIDLARALVSYHEKAFSIGSDVVRRMTGRVRLVRSVEEDLGYHWYEHHGVGRFETKQVRVS